MKSHDNAFCVAGERHNRRSSGFGLYGADGALLPDCTITTPDWTTRPEPQAQAQADAPRLFGPALFAGCADKQFGFVLLNALGRLWALEALPPETNVVFAAKPQAAVPGYGFVPLILRALGLQNPIVITHGALNFERIWTAPEIFGEAIGGRALPGFYDWIDRRWPAAAPPDPERRIYVSRSGLGPNAGRFACEDHLERLLAAEGYEIYAPEQHPLADQIATFQSAGRLIFAEGSALHLFALLRRPGQISAVINRRADLPAVMRAQMADRPGQATAEIKTLVAEWWPPQRGDHLGLSVLDFTSLGAQLRDLDLIAANAGWTAPPPGAEEASLHAGLPAGAVLMTADQHRDWKAERRKARRKDK